MNKLSIQIIAVIAFVAIAVGALYYGGVFGNAETGNQIDRTDREPRTVQILNYSDYSCPACKAYVPMQERLKAEFGDLVDIQYRYFVLGSFPHSDLAAYAVEAANQQGKFKEMHDLVYEYQERWSPRQADAEEYFINFAEQIGLDMDQFLEDIESEEVRNRVEAHREEGIRRQVNATPTFFVDGHRLRQNPQSYEQFKSIVELYMYRSN